MTLRNVIIFNFLIGVIFVKSQSVSHVYKINDLLSRINNSDTTYIINFWATWCKPCVKELPSFDSLYLNSNKQNLKILLVSLDFIDDIEKKLNPFLLKNKIKLECVVLDEINGNDFINKVDEKWTGALPATLIKLKDKRIFIEKPISLKSLNTYLAEIYSQ
jgi:thiol-disulfide isomerase/thioredoxin